MKKTTLLLIFAFQVVTTFYGQAPFNLVIEPMNIDQVGGLHSYAFGQDQGKWLILGGRLDGLHQRQPFAAFDVAGNNTQIMVIDPVNEQKWEAPLSSLPVGMQEQLSATNMQFHQEGDYLYFIGGYGYSATEDDHITYDKLTAINVPAVIDAVINGTDFTAYFRQIGDADFAVTGGRLRKINDTYYLAGGQYFEGRYNPMGPNNGPGFVQEYTDEIRLFTIEDDGTNITINHLPSYVNADEFHRRDYNVEPQIMPNGEEGMTLFSGVFQVDAELPFLNCVNVDAEGYTVNNDFQQYYNHYHCGVIPLYSANNNEMHTVFFGGIAQFYDNNGTLVQDDNVPFVKTIARVTRDQEGVMTEYLMPIEMPELLGAGAEFIPVETIPHFNNDVIKLDEITESNVLIGYIYGGISSTALNIFFTNTGVESSATSQIFKVYLTDEVGVHQLNNQSEGTLNMSVYPNPNSGDFIINFYLKTVEDVKITITNSQGKLIEDTTLYNQKIGENSYSRALRKSEIDSVYFVTLETKKEKVTRKIIVE